MSYRSYRSCPGSCSLGFYFIPLGSVLVPLGLILCPWGSCSVRVPSPSFILSPIDIFKFLFRKREWVKLYIMLATQSIKARAQQEGCRQACTIGLSINEDTKLEKGKEKKGSAARSFMRSSGHVGSRDCVYHNVYHNPPFSTSAVTPKMLI